MTYDPVFPLPEPMFLWVHDLLVHPHGASVVLGPGRKWRYADTTAASVVGYITSPKPSEVFRAAQAGVVVDAVALVPNGTAVDENDELEAPAAPLVAGASIPPVLVGRYGISSVRPNPSHTRVLLTRVRGEDNPHADD